jgi:CHAT domain-containing protein
MFQIWRYWQRFSLFVLASFVFCLVLHTGSTGQAKPPTLAQKHLVSSLLNQGLPPDTPTVQQGIEHYQAGKFTEAIALWEAALPQIFEDKQRAIIYTNLALAYRQIGQFDREIANRGEAIEIYRAQADAATRQPLAGVLTEQAQAYSNLGQQQRAITLLESALEIAQQNRDSEALQSTDHLTQSATQGVLGNAYRALGEYEKALAAHEISLKIARELNNVSYIATALNNLGNVYMSRANRLSYQANVADSEGDEKEALRLTQAVTQNRVQARTFFEQSVQTARGVAAMEEVRALLNLTRLLEVQSRDGASQNTASPNEDLIVGNWNRVREVLNNAPDSHEKAYFLINLAESFRRHNFVQHQESIQVLEQALAVAKAIGDARAESFALGSLGQVQEVAGEYSKAMELTRTAQFAAQQVNIPDSLYRWQWQAGRILKSTGDREQAIVAYQQAIATLQSIRGDIVAANRELQFDFTEQVEPVYRELMELLLAPSDITVKSQLIAQQGGEANPNPNPKSNVEKAVDTLELLKLAELQNFFGDECVQLALAESKENGSLADTNTAVVYSVILNNQTQMILRSPNGSLANYRIAISKPEIEAEINQLRYFLESRATEEYITQVQKIYDLLIRPIEADLTAIQPTTLLFINDGVLRKVPMAALHDGKEFLIQKYPIAIAPSLTLTARKPLDHSNLEALSLGLTVERSPFAPLTNVAAEVTAVNKILGGTELLDEAFTLPNLQEQLQKKNFPIVHIATHGKFGVDAESTFIVGFDQRISIEQIDKLLRFRNGRKSVELLTLSACQTATGDNRSALGIAGVAVRAGVKSALATLWYINDEATVPLIEEFYSQLRQPNISKAEALRNAQIKMITDVNYNHPAVWSPFVLIGNWL